jgi:hypothetical protein
VTTACASYPCATGAVSIALGASCPLPLGGAASGTVMVSGSWQDKDHATLSSQFVDAKAGARDEVVTTATNLTVSRSGSSLTVTYTGQDVNVQGASALAAQSSWTVVVDTAGTGDPGDDGYTVTGVQQGAGGGGGGQVSVSDAVLAAGCTQNPTSGSAVIQSAGLTSIENDTVTFHAACDGQAELQTTTGSKETVALDFLAQ